MAKPREFRVELSKRDLDWLRKNVGIAPGQTIAGNRITEIKRVAHQHYIILPTYHEAVSFAIWAAGWIATERKDGRCPLVSPPINMN